MKRYRLALAALAVMAALSLVALPSSNAASTVSNTTYVVNGREVPVGFDPITLKNGTLLPQVLIEDLGIIVTDLNTGVVLLKRGSLEVRITIGSKLATSSRSGLILATAPLRLSGQIFVPVDALDALGVGVSNESGYVWVDVWPLAEGPYTDPAKYSQAVQTAYRERTVSPTRETIALVEVVRLNEDIIMGQAWTTAPAMRGRARDLVKGSSLFQVNITNRSSKPVTFAPSSYFLVDNLGNQYRLSDERIPLQGDLFGTVAPGAVVSGVLVYPPLEEEAQSMTLYLQDSVTVQSLGFFSR